MFLNSPVPAGRSACAFLVGLALLAVASSGWGQEGLANECDYGITLALSGEPAKAESVFVSLLSKSPRDPRALTNLGNLALLGGDPEMALAFYDRAAKADTLDAGIVLNRAVALMLLGDENSAAEEAKAGIMKSGGDREAAALLGLRPGEMAVQSGRGDKATDKPRIDKSEVAALLTAARKSVPQDSARAEGEDQSPSEKKGATRTWRSAGARSAEGNVVPDVLYWKR